MMKINKIEKLDKDPIEGRCQYVRELTNKINEIIDIINENSISEEKPIILECPWCRALPTIKYYKYVVYGYYILCENKDCSVKPEMDKQYITEEKAIKAWKERK